VTETTRTRSFTLRVSQLPSQAPVIDVYDIDFTSAGRPFSLMPLAALRQAAQDQLGLELVPTRAVLVVERVRAEVAR
jgi:hypothetical protein